MKTLSDRRPYSGFRWIAVALMTILGYFLIMEHWAHIVPWLPYLLLLGCVAMHLFMHGGHGGGHGGGHDDTNDKGEER